MWIGFIAGWVAGSAALYVYLIATAREPQHQECMDCHSNDCSACPRLNVIEEESAFRRAA